MLTRTAATAFLLLLCLSTAFAEDRLGVAVYPGAQYDQARTSLLKDSLSAQGAAYRTKDDIAKVIAFYRKQGLLFLKMGGPANKVARFKKTGTGVDVVVQNPWKDSKTGATMTDTLILIYQKAEKGIKPDVTI